LHYCFKGAFRPVIYKAKVALMPPRCKDPPKGDITALPGAYLHKPVADIRLKTQSQESTMPTDVIKNTGAVFNGLMQ
jgi:hypothetical protein